MIKSIYLLVAITFVIVLFTSCAPNNKRSFQDSIYFATNQAENGGINEDGLIFLLNNQLYLFDSENIKLSAYCKIQGCDHDSDNIECQAYIDGGSLMGSYDNKLYVAFNDPYFHIDEMDSETMQKRRIVFINPKYTSSNPTYPVFGNKYCYYRIL